MKKALTLAMGLMAFCNPVLASDIRLEAIVTSGSSQANATALQPGYEYVLQCTADTRYRTCATSSCTAVSTDLLIPAGTGLIVVMPSVAEAGVDHSWLAIIATSSTCQLYSSIPRLSPVAR